MMKCIVRFFDNAKRVINESLKSERKISWAIINNSIEKQLLELSQMKFRDPAIPKSEADQYFNNLCEEIDNEFRKLLLG
jgi:hypothetical protein